MPSQRIDSRHGHVLTAVSDGMTSNNQSSQALVKDHYETGIPTAGFVVPSSTNSTTSLPQRRAQLDVKNLSPNHVTRTQWCAILILTFVNLINYMDRYTIAGILPKVQAYYRINNAEGGLLQTAFVASYMIFAPLFGFLGDRYSRKWVMTVGIFIWALATLAGSFMTEFYWFLTMRALVGIGEASYSTIAPTILSDLFVKEMRSKALAIFYFAIPVGSGLGYVVGKALSGAFNEWQWALRGTPILGAVAVILVLFFLVDPPRGESEGHDQLKATTYREDLVSLAGNKSFIFSTLGFTCVTFCTGALAWWGPKFLEDAIKSNNVADEDLPMDPNRVAFYFGLVTMTSGIVGVPLGSLLSTKLRPKNYRADPLICGLGLGVSAVFLLLAIFVLNVNFFLAFVLIFLGEISLNLNWSIVADILLYVVVPTRRGTAEALQILISHLFGDAGSPYLIGAVSDALRTNSVTTEEFCLDPSETEILAPNATTLCSSTRDFYSMQYSLLVNIVVEVLGAMCFFITAIFIIKDKLNVERYISDYFEQSRDQEDPMFRGESNSLADSSSDDDSPPQLIVATTELNEKMEPLLSPLNYKYPSKSDRR